MHKNMLRVAGILAVSGLTSGALAQAHTTFDNGTEGWSVSGRDNISMLDGRPGANMAVLVEDVWGIDIRNDSNPAFLGDYTRFAEGFEISVDIRFWSINMLGTEVERELVFELKDFDNPNGYPWTSVWVSLGRITSQVHWDPIPTDPDGWVTYTMQVTDVFAEDLPDGWGGTGDEDPNTYEPTLPASRSFSSVLASVDQISITSLVPGFFYGFTNFDMQVDNIILRPLGDPAVCLGDIADDFGFTVNEGGGPDGQVDFGDFVALLGLIGPCP